MIRIFLSIWIRPFLAIAVLLILLLGAGATGDEVFLSNSAKTPAWIHYVLPDQGSVAVLIGDSIEYQVAIVGIAITVASILVQLSATRYSSRVMDLFIEDKVNFAVFCLYMVVPIHGVWLSYTIHVMPFPSIHFVIHRILSVLGLLLLIPYFSYVFYFLRPESIILRIQGGVNLKIITRNTSIYKIQKVQKNMVGSVTQMSDIVSNSISNSDMHLALLSITSLKTLVATYIERKANLPDIWFHIPTVTFLGFERSSLERMEKDRTWVEMHCLKQFELIFRLGLNKFREITAAIAHTSRDLGMLALKRNDEKGFELVILFFNTYLRHAINAFDIRTMFHTFYQYRLLAEGCLALEWREMLRKIAWYFKYYGQECERRGVAFAMEIAAYDLRVLVEKAASEYPAVVDDLLDVFLEIDHVPDTDSERSQRGVRKNQAILAAFFLDRGNFDVARRIFEDMRHEDPERMRSIGKELEPESSKDFWEIQERGSNFYYVAPELREHLVEFFSWFDPAPTPVG